MTFTAPATDSVAAAQAKRSRSVGEALGILMRDDLAADTRIAMATSLLYRSTCSCKNMDNRPVEPTLRDELCVRYGRCEPKKHQFTSNCVYALAVAGFVPVDQLQAVS